MRQIATNSQQVGQEFTNPQELALSALLLGRSVAEAADTAGVDRSTMHRWKKDPRFEAELNRLRADARAVLTANIERILSRAVRSA